MDSLVQQAIEEVALHGHLGCSPIKLWKMLAYDGKRLDLDLQLCQWLWNHLQYISSIQVSEASSHDASVESVPIPQSLKADSIEIENVQSGPGAGKLLIASVPLQWQILSTNDSSTREIVSKLSIPSMTILAMVALSRRAGITQADVSKELAMDPRTTFYHLKPLIASRLIFKVPVRTKKMFTHLLIHCRFLSNEHVHVDEEVSNSGKISLSVPVGRPFSALSLRTSSPHPPSRPITPTSSFSSPHLWQMDSAPSDESFALQPPLIDTTSSSPHLFHHQLLSSPSLPSLLQPQPNLPPNSNPSTATSNNELLSDSSLLISPSNSTSIDPPSNSTSIDPLSNSTSLCFDSSFNTPFLTTTPTTNLPPIRNHDSNIFMFRSKITTLLSQALNQTMVTVDIKKCLGLERKEDKKYFDRTVSRMCDEEFIERVTVQKDGGTLRCLHLLRLYDSVINGSASSLASSFPISSTSVPPAHDDSTLAIVSDARIYLDLPFPHQLYQTILSAGAQGLTSAEIGLAFRDLNPRVLYNYLLSMSNEISTASSSSSSNQSSLAKITRLVESNGRQRRWRFFSTETIPGYNPHPHSSVHLESDKNQNERSSNPPLSALPQPLHGHCVDSIGEEIAQSPEVAALFHKSVNSLVSPVHPRDSATSSMRRKHLLKLLEEHGVLELGTKLCRLFHSRFCPHQPMIDRKTMGRMVDRSAQLGLLQVVRVAIKRLNGSPDMRVLVAHNKLDVEGKQMKTLIKQMKARWGKVASSEGGGGKIGHFRHYRTLEGADIERFTWDGAAVVLNSEDLSKELADVAKISSVTRDSPNGFFWLEVATSFGYKTAKWTRVSQFHAYLMRLYMEKMEIVERSAIVEKSAIIQNLPPAALCLDEIIGDMPFILFLEIIGQLRHSDVLSQYLDENQSGDRALSQNNSPPSEKKPLFLPKMPPAPSQPSPKLSIKLCDLPPEIYMEVFKDATRIKKSVLAMFDAMILLELVEKTEDHEFLLRLHAHVRDFTNNEVAGSFELEKEGGVCGFWSTLESYYRGCAFNRCDTETSHIPQDKLNLMTMLRWTANWQSSKRQSDLLGQSGGDDAAAGVGRLLSIDSAVRLSPISTSRRRHGASQRLPRRSRKPLHLQSSVESGVKPGLLHSETSPSNHPQSPDAFPDSSTMAQRFSQFMENVSINRPIALSNPPPIVPSLSLKSGMRLMSQFGVTAGDVVRRVKFTRCQDRELCFGYCFLKHATSIEQLAWSRFNHFFSSVRASQCKRRIFQLRKNVAAVEFLSREIEQSMNGLMDRLGVYSPPVKPSLPSISLRAIVDILMELIQFPDSLLDDSVDAQPTLDSSHHAHSPLMVIPTSLEHFHKLYSVEAAPFTSSHDKSNLADQINLQSSQKLKLDILHHHPLFIPTAPSILTRDRLNQDECPITESTLMVETLVKMVLLSEANLALVSFKLLSQLDSEVLTDVIAQMKESGVLVDARVGANGVRIHNRSFQLSFKLWKATLKSGVADCCFRFLSTLGNFNSLFEDAFDWNHAHTTDTSFSTSDFLNGGDVLAVLSECASGRMLLNPTPPSPLTIQELQAPITERTEDSIGYLIDVSVRPVQPVSSVLNNRNPPPPSTIPTDCGTLGSEALMLQQFISISGPQGVFASFLFQKMFPLSRETVDAMDQLIRGNHVLLIGFQHHRFIHVEFIGHHFPELIQSTPRLWMDIANGGVCGEVLTKLIHALTTRLSIAPGCSFESLCALMCVTPCEVVEILWLLIRSGCVYWERIFVLENSRSAGVEQNIDSDLLVDIVPSEHLQMISLISLHRSLLHPPPTTSSFVDSFFVTCDFQKTLSHLDFSLLARFHPLWLVHFS